jgi:nucleotide-binding universal stress UspA family protein
MSRRILVCLDGSSAAEQVLPEVVEHALTSGGELLLLQVLNRDHDGSPVNGGRVTPARNGDPLRTLDALGAEVEREYYEASVYLRCVADPLRRIGLRVETTTAKGSAGDAIVRFALIEGIDLIALAAYGRGGRILGRTARTVLRRAGVPVLLARPDHSVKSGADAACTRVYRPRSRASTQPSVAAAMP